MKILLALGADPHAPALVRGLRLDGWSVAVDPGGEDAVQFVEGGGFDAALIGTGLPAAHRLTERLRLAAPDLAVMALGAAPDLAVKARLFEAGADDVLSHPVSAEEIGLRARAIARRRHGHLSRAIRFGDLAVVPGEHAAVTGRMLPLARAEFALLEFLALRAGRPVGRGPLMAALFGGVDEPAARAIDVRLCKLRRVLADYGLPAGLIGTVWGIGWIMPAPYPPGAPMPPHRAEVVRPAVRDCAGAAA